jgi:hypothetical protein
MALVPLDLKQEIKENLKELVNNIEKIVLDGMNSLSNNKILYYSNYRKHSRELLLKSTQNLFGSGSTQKKMLQHIFCSFF